MRRLFVSKKFYNLHTLITVFGILITLPYFGFTGTYMVSVS